MIEQILINRVSKQGKGKEETKVGVGGEGKKVTERTRQQIQQQGCETEERTEASLLATIPP